MKLFQIITLDGEFQGKFSVEFKKSNGDLEDHDVEITPTIDDLNVFYCNGLTFMFFTVTVPVPHVAQLK